MVIIENDFQRVALSALLHDIGKLLHRSNVYAQKSTLHDKKHPSLSTWFIDHLVENEFLQEDEKLRVLVQKHHENYQFPEYLRVDSIQDRKLRNLAVIVSQADNYSSQERDDSQREEESNFRTRPLDSIFASVDIGKEYAKSKMRYSLKEFSETSIMPKEISENSQEEITVLIEKFLTALKEIKAVDFHTFYVNLLDILKKYTWCLPSDTQANVCDISLYDHLKNSSAIAISSYLYLKDRYGDVSKVDEKEILKARKEERFLLIGGDISGIQKYIYALESTSGIAKRLRSRSFFIKILANMASYRFVEEIGLEISNIIISSGGKFYILAPNSERVREKVVELEEKINQELYEKYQTQIFLNIAMLSLSGDDLGKEFSKKYDSLNDLLGQNKHRKFHKQIQEKPIVEDSLYAKHSDIRSCKICQKQLTLEEECEFCKLDFEIGGVLPFLEKIYVYKNKQQSSVKNISIFDWNVYLETEKEKFVIKEEPFLSLYYRKDSLQERSLPYFQDFYGGYIPLENDLVKTFEEIAAESNSNNLGILKGDVDNLGFIFSMGLKNAEMISISRISFLSNMMDAFFSYYLPKYLREKEESYYIVYSGGDDFMIVGAWDKLFVLAREIRDKFREFVAENPNITLTEGIAITKPKDPIYFSSIWATEAEEFGKNRGKNGVVIFGTYIPWEEYYFVMRFIDFVEKQFMEKIYSQSFLYRLLYYTNMMEKYEETKDSKYLKYMSDFNYDTNRNLLPKLREEYQMNKVTKKVEEDERYTELSKYFGIESLLQNDAKNREFARKYMRMILNYVIRKNRGEKDGNIQ